MGYYKLNTDGTIKSRSKQVDNTWLALSELETKEDGSYYTYYNQDGTADLAKEEAETLSKAKVSKLIEIQDDFALAEEQPVIVNTVSYYGGADSATAIDSYIRLNRLVGNTSHNIWDINGVEHILTDAEVDVLLVNIGSEASTNKFTKKNRKVALAVATTIAEVEVI